MWLLIKSQGEIVREKLGMEEFVTYRAFGILLPPSLKVVFSVIHLSLIFFF